MIWPGRCRSGRASFVSAVNAPTGEEDAVKQYLLSIYQPDGPTPPPEVLDGIVEKLDALNADLKAAGAWVFAGGLHPPSTATVLRAGRADSGDTLVTDGPYAEGKEHLGGFT